MLKRVGYGIGMVSVGAIGGIWMERNRNNKVPYAEIRSIDEKDEVVDVIGAVGNTPLLDIKINWMSYTCKS